MELLNIIGSALLCTAVCFGPILFIAYGLPTLAYISQRRGARRKKRHNQQHESKMPYRALAYLFLAVSVAAVVYVIVLFANGSLDITENLEGLGAILVLPIILTIVNFRAYILQKMPTGAKALKEDARPPVLYLRSFDQESLKFVHLPEYEKKKYNDLIVYADDVDLPPFERKLFNLMNNSAILTANAPVYGEDVTFEKYFRGEVTKRLGPFVALGNPIDDLPAEGAFRDYQTDESWKQVFFERAEQCACILMQLGSSNNLQFELTSILSRGMRQKLFILTPPQENVRDRMAWVRKFILKETPATWEVFASILKGNGYQIPTEPLRVGCVLTFEPDGRPLVLTQGAFQPEEYILPISKRLESLASASPSAR